MSDEPRVLLVTSPGASEVAVTPVLAALEAAGCRVRAIDSGRIGARHEGAVERMFHAIVGELAERRLAREIELNPPQVCVCFDPGTAAALSVARDQSRHPAPVIGIATELAPSREWGATDCDRYLTVDDEAAVALSELGVAGERILPVGPFCEHAFARAAATARAELRTRFQIAAGAVVVVEVAGFGYDRAQQIALQLSLLGGGAVTYLFDAGTDAEAATALRRQVPTLELRAKLFGATADTPALWRAAEVVIARPREAAVQRALMVGARVVSFLPEGPDEEAAAKALLERQRGATADNALLLSSALEPLLKQPEVADRRVGLDGARTAADIAWIVGRERLAILEQRRRVHGSQTRERVHAAADAAEAAARTSAMPGELEDLGGSPPPAQSIPDAAELARLRSEVKTRLAAAGQAMTRARQAADAADREAASERGHGREEAAQAAQRRADEARTRMHAALREMAELEGEMQRLETAARRVAAAPRGAAARRPPPPSAPPKASIDDMLADLKRRQGEAPRASAKPPKPENTVDDELEALKRKMAQKKKRP